MTVRGLHYWFLALLLPAILFSGPLPAPAAAFAHFHLPTFNLWRFIGDAPQVRYLDAPIIDGHRLSMLGNVEAFSGNVALFRFINDHRSRWLDYLCFALMYLGSGWIVLPVTIAAAFIRRRLLPVLLLALACETVIVLLMKELLSQPRPAGLLGDLYLTERLDWNSLPSGDTAMAFVLAWALKRHAHPWAQAAFIAYAVLVAYERLYFGAHFPLDVLIGAAIGIGAVKAAEFMLERKSKPASRSDYQELSKAA